MNFVILQMWLVIQIQAVEKDYIKINKDHFLINEIVVWFRNSLIDSSLPIKASNGNLERICEELHLRDNENAKKGKQFLRNVDNFYIDENRKLGWCVIPKVCNWCFRLKKGIVAKYNNFARCIRMYKRYMYQLTSGQNETLLLNSTLFPGRLVHVEISPDASYQ